MAGDGIGRSARFWRGGAGSGQAGPLGFTGDAAGNHRRCHRPRFRRCGVLRAAWRQLATAGGHRRCVLVCAAGHGAGSGSTQARQFGVFSGPGHSDAAGNAVQWLVLAESRGGSVVHGLRDDLQCRGSHRPLAFRRGGDALPRPADLRYRGNHRRRPRSASPRRIRRGGAAPGSIARTVSSVTDGSRATRGHGLRHPGNRDRIRSGSQDRTDFADRAQRRASSDRGVHDFRQRGGGAFSATPQDAGLVPDSRGADHGSPEQAAGLFRGDGVGAGWRR